MKRLATLLLFLIAASTILAQSGTNKVNQKTVFAQDVAVAGNLATTGTVQAKGAGQFASLGVDGAGTFGGTISAPSTLFSMLTAGPAALGSTVIAGTLGAGASTLGATTVNGTVATTGDVMVGTAGAGNRTLTMNSAGAGNTLTLNTYAGSAGITCPNLLAITSTSGYAKLISGSSAAWLVSGANQPMYFDAGSSFYFRNADASNANIATLDSSTGELQTNGDHKLGSDGTGARTITLYSDTAGKFLTIKSLTGGAGQIMGNGGGLMEVNGGTGYVEIKSGANQPMYLDAGGLFAWTDRDSSPAYQNRMTLDSSSGALWTAGDISQGADAGGARKITLNSGTTGKQLVIGTGSDGGASVVGGGGLTLSGAGAAKLVSSGTYAWVASNANQPMYFDCGDKFNFRDADTGNTNIATINSATGDLWTSGTLTLGGTTKVSANGSTGNINASGQIYGGSLSAVNGQPSYKLLARDGNIILWSAATNAQTTPYYIWRHDTNSETYPVSGIGFYGGGLNNHQGAITFMGKTSGYYNSPNLELGRFNFDGNFGIGDNAPAEKLTVAGNVKATGNVSATGNFNTTGGAYQINGTGVISSTRDINCVGLTTTGPVILGDAAADIISCTGSFATDLIPNQTNTRNLGSSSARWNSIYGAGLDVTGTVSSSGESRNAHEIVVSGYKSGIAQSAATAFARIQPASNGGNYTATFDVTVTADMGAGPDLAAHYTLTMACADSGGLVAVNLTQAAGAKALTSSSSLDVSSCTFSCANTTSNNPSDLKSNLVFGGSSASGVAYNIAWTCTLRWSGFSGAPTITAL